MARHFQSHLQRHHLAGIMKNDPGRVYQNYLRYHGRHLRLRHQRHPRVEEYRNLVFKHYRFDKIWKQRHPRFHISIGAMSGAPLNIASFPAASLMSHLSWRHKRRSLGHLQSRTLWASFSTTHGALSVLFPATYFGVIGGVSGGCLGGPRI